MKYGASQVALVLKNPPANGEDMRHKFDPWVRRIPWRRKWKPTPVVLPGESHGQRSLAGYRTQGYKRVGHNLVTKQQNTVHLKLKQHCKATTLRIKKICGSSSERGLYIWRSAQGKHQGSL